MLIALLSPIPALFAFWADASGDWLPDVWVDPASGHVFTLSELNAFSDDIDGDGLSNAQEMAIGTNPFSPDTDGDGISDLLDPLPLSASNLSPANGIVWGAIALDDADGDGIPNFLDDFPYGQFGAQLGTPDTDGDGISDIIDPAPWDYSNWSPVNGLQWMGDALADADGDGVPNFHDWYPYDASLWDPMQDPDGDGFVKAKDPHPADPYNPSPVNGLNWGPDVYGDSDGDGIPNFYDAYPYDSGNGYVPSEPDADGDGIPDSVDPSPWDYDNFSAANGISWQWDARGDADNDGISNFYDQFPYDYYNGNVPVSDIDGDGIPDAEDPAPTDPTNLSPVNGGLWYTAALADADGDGNPNFTDPWPYDPTNGNLPPEWNSPTADTDGDGIANAQDPALADPLNFSIYNGTSWYADAIGDIDADGIVNFRDEHPYDYYNGGYAGPDSDGDGIPDSQDPYPSDPNNGNGDADGDGITDISDPAQTDPNNPSPFNGIEWFGDVRGDADGDGILNFWDLEPYGPTPVDTDGDGLIDSIDPAPTDPYNFSAYNKTSWSSDALGDADGDGIPNYFDTWPYDSLNGTGDADMDGLPDASDPVPADPYNNSPYNGAMWSGPSALGDVDNDGILNYFDAYPDDPYNGLPPGGDADGDGIPNEQDPDPRNGTNTSPYNGINWGEGANGDADGDGTANYWDYSPYGDDLDGDGIRDSDDPAPNDATNTSWINGRAWYGEALGDDDRDGTPNFYDPDGGMPYEPYLGELPSASASQLVLVNDGYEELGEAPAPGVTPARDLDNPELAIKAGSRAGKMAISRLTALNLSLPADYVNAGGSVTFTQSGAGFVRLHAVRMVDGEGVEGREISMGVPYVPPNDGTWVHLIESVSGGGVTLTCHFPWMLYGEITGDHPSGVMSFDVDVDLPLVSVEITEEVEPGEEPKCTGYDMYEKALMVPMSGSNKIRVKIGAFDNLLSKVKITASDPGKLTIQPETPASNDQILTLSGSAKALGVKIQVNVNDSKTDLFEADVLGRLEKTIEIHAITEQNDDVQRIALGAPGVANAVCVSSGPNGFRDTVPNGDDVIDGNSITVGANGVCDTIANNQNLVPVNVPSAASLQSFLNGKTWGNQANVYFTVTRVDYVVNYDLDRNQKLADEFDISHTRAEDDVITAAARSEVVDFNAYYINQHEYPIGITLRNQIFTQGSAPGLNSPVNHTAHEVGHLLGRRGHDGAGADALMHPSGLPTNPCRILRNEWRIVNP
jgi:hypothetical protein